MGQFLNKIRAKLGLEPRRDVTLTGKTPNEIIISRVTQNESVDPSGPEDNPVVLAPMRMSPPTPSHGIVVNKAMEIAKAHGAPHHIILTRSHDVIKKKTGSGVRNPLTPEQKLKHAKRFFPDANIEMASQERPNLLSQAAELHQKGHKHLIVVAGSDRVSEYHNLLNKYNGQIGKHGYFNFPKISVVAAGAERDPDAEGSAGWSGTKSRQTAETGDFNTFRKKAVPSHINNKHAKELYDDLRSGMGVQGSALAPSHSMNESLSDYYDINTPEGEKNYDEYYPKIKSLEQKLKEIGSADKNRQNTVQNRSQLLEDPDAEKILKQGKTWKQENLSPDHCQGTEGECHWNTAKAFKSGKVHRIVVGYARNHQGWHQHTWGLDHQGRVVETTGSNRNNTHWHGYPLSQEESEAFSNHVLKPENSAGNGNVRTFKGNHKIGATVNEASEGYPVAAIPTRPIPTKDARDAKGKRSSLNNLRPPENKGNIGLDSDLGDGKKNFNLLRRRALKRAVQVGFLEGYDDIGALDTTKAAPTTSKIATSRINGKRVKAENFKSVREACWANYKQVGTKKKNGRTVPNCVPKEEVEIDEGVDKNHPIVKEYNALKKHDIKALRGMIAQSGGVVDTSGFKSKDHAISHLIRAKHGNKKVDQAFGFNEEHSESCPNCGGDLVNEEFINEKKDACYYKIKSRYKVWPSAYASGALVKCRNSSKNESLHDWFTKEKWVRMDTKGNIKGDCAREPGEGKPKCLPQAKAYSLGKKGRASAAARKRREDPNPNRSGAAINVNTMKQKAQTEAANFAQQAAIAIAMKKAGKKPKSVEEVYDRVNDRAVAANTQRYAKQRYNKTGIIPGSATPTADAMAKFLNKGGQVKKYDTFGNPIGEELLHERGEDKKGYFRSTESGAGITRKGAKAMGIHTAVTTPPSKLDPNGKAAARRRSFCARMGGMKGPMKDEKGRPTRKAMSLRRWHCEDIKYDDGDEGHTHKAGSFHRGDRVQIKKDGYTGKGNIDMYDPTSDSYVVSTDKHGSNLHLKASEIEAIKEAKARPYVKPYMENGKQVGYKSSDGYHVKYWRLADSALEKAKKHAKVDTVSEHIVKVKGGFELKSKTTGKNLGKYPTKAGAEQRERQVQYFKHMGEESLTDRVKAIMEGKK